MALNDFGDSKVTVKKEDLLKEIRKNREAHRSAFLRAQEGYRTAVIEELDRALQDARKGKEFRTFFHLDVPVEHTREYDVVVRMLEMSTADEITITQKQFTQFVMDDWGWKEAFIGTISKYHINVES